MKKTLMLVLGLLAGCAQAEWREVSAAELLQRQATGEQLLLVDVRSADEFAGGHVPGAINLPHGEVTGNEPALREWKQKPVVIYCQSGRRAGMAAKVLAAQGFTRIEHLAGDMPGWRQSGQPVAR